MGHILAEWNSTEEWGVGGRTFAMIVVVVAAVYAAAVVSGYDFHVIAHYAWTWIAIRYFGLYHELKQEER